MTSKLANKPILLSIYKDGVECLIQDNIMLISGTLGAKDLHIPANITVVLDHDKLWISEKSDYFSNLNKDYSVTVFIHQIINALKGVSEGFVRDLELVGVGYRAYLKSGKQTKDSKETDWLDLRVGYSNSLQVFLPIDVSVSCPKPTLISIFGIEKYQVHHLAAKIRHLVKTEPYKGKGIVYVGEVIARKEGKRH